MKIHLLRAIVAAALVATGCPSFAQCDALVRGGVFEYASLASDEQRATSFQNWARDRRGSKSTDSASGKLGVDLIEILKLDAGGQSTKSAEFWQDVENYNSSNIAQRTRLLSYAKTVSSVLVEGLNKCLSIKGLHVWLETTARVDTFRVAANFNSPGDPIYAKVIGVPNVKPAPPAVRCDKVFDSAKIGGSTKRLTCVRTSCEGVTIALNTSVDAMGGGTLELPATGSCNTPVIVGKTIAEKIIEGKTFTVVFDSLVSNIGSIYPGRALVGNYSQGEKAWRVWGPNGPTGRLLPQGSNEGLYGCGAVVVPANQDAACSAPLDYKLNVWGALFAFDEQGVVRYNGTLAGHVNVPD